MIDSEIVCYEIYKEFFKQFNIAISKADYLNCFAGRSKIVLYMQEINII